VDPANSDHLIAGIPNQGLYRSQDRGTTWQHVSAGLEPNGEHRDIVFDLQNPGTVYTSDIKSGVYRSEDSGSTWHKINEGLTNRAATALSLSADGNHLYAGTSGGGVFRLDLTGNPPVSTGVTLFQEESVPMDEPQTDQEPQPELGDQPPESVQDEQEKDRFSLPCLGGMLPALLLGMTVINLRVRKRLLGD
jgi:hypothetical protein